MSREAWIVNRAMGTDMEPEIPNLKAVKPGVVTEENYHLIRWLLADDDELTVDTETTGLDPFRGDYIVGVAVRGAMAGPFYFPFRHQPGGNLPEEWLYSLGLWIMSKPTVWFNAPFDIKMFRREGVPFPTKPIQDTQLAAHLHNENEYVTDAAGNVRFRSDGKPITTYALKNLARRKLNHPTHGEKELLNLIRSRFRCGPKKGDAMQHLWRLHPKEVAPYACEDVELTCKLRDYYRPLLEEEGLWDLFLEVSHYALVTARMECNGLPVNLETLEANSAEARTKAAELRLEMSRRFSRGDVDLFGTPNRDFNPGSPKQVCSLLGLPDSAKNTLEDALRRAPDGSNRKWWIEAIMAYRQWTKAEGSFYSVYRDKIGEDGRLHPNFNLAGTVAGRPSCSNPNLTAVARRTEEYKVKDIFEAPPGRLLLSVDYSQAEVRWGTYYANAKRMLEILLSGESIHRATERDIAGVDYDLAKRLNFGGIYGVGAKTFAKNAHMTEYEAYQYLLRFRQTHPEFQQLLQTMEGSASAAGFIVMWTGRRRRYDEVGSPAHKASSNLIQGAVAEMLRTAMCRIDTWIEENGYRNRLSMLLQVHDQILFEIDEDWVDAMAPHVIRIMETAADISVPLPVEAKVGKSWGSLEVVTF